MTGWDDFRFDRYYCTVSADLESLFKDNFFLGCRTALPPPENKLFLPLRKEFSPKPAKDSVDCRGLRLQPWGSRDLIEIFGYLQNWLISLASGCAKTFLTVRTCRFMQL